MERRLELQTILETLLGSRNVYFQPPPTLRMQYPCIVYKRDRNNTQFANNLPYVIFKAYTLTVIDKDPDSDIPGKIEQLPSCSFVRHFTVDNLNHDIYSLYY